MPRRPTESGDCQEPTRPSSNSLSRSQAFLALLFRAGSLAKSKDRLGSTQGMRSCLGHRLQACSLEHSPVPGYSPSNAYASGSCKGKAKAPKFVAVLVLVALSEFGQGDTS